MMGTVRPLSVVVLISGHGSNLQAIIDAMQSKLLHINLKAVISSTASAYGLKRAEKAQIPSHIVLPQDYKDRAAYDEALSIKLATYQPDLIVLAGFMRILGSQFLDSFKNKIINIHPSLLPNYPGFNTHELALADGANEHGCSVHFVNEDLDAGPLIAQAAIKIKFDDSPSTLKDKVHKAEHFLYPVVVKWFAEQRIELINNQVLIDNVILPPNGLQFALDL